ncbi:MAG TPA: AraC family transcriptional regulator [Ktedonosporobacter sp.]|nr:AraC family transcriptional regulator [Ktedonosporobacter sp.]
MAEEAWSSSFILHARGRSYYWQGRGFLSIKTFSSGQAYYNVGKGYYAVDDTSYLVLNHDQPYTITIESESPVESFCIFFEPGLAEEVYRSLTTAPQVLIDEPAASTITPLSFFERTYQHDHLLSPALHHLRAIHRLGDRDYTWLYEQFNDLLQRLLQVHFNVYREVETLPAVRAATREEIYRRIYRARDYASALFDVPITLEEMARVANLSPNHFLRMFKQVFQQTPHQFVISKRLEQAQHLLLHTERSVTDIGFSVGFTSLGSFSWLFRQRIGISPEGYRRQKGDF